MCNHNWNPSHNHLGLFAWKCDRCQAIKEADPQRDQPFLLAYAQTLNQQFIEALNAWINAPKPQKKAYQSKVHARYWVTRISYLRAGIQDDIAQTEDLAKRFPCPPELRLIFSLLKPPLSAWDELAEPLEEIPRRISKESSTFDKPSRKTEGETNTQSNEIPRRISKESSTSDKPSRKKRNHGLGTGSIFIRSVTKGKNVYQEYWFKYAKGNRQKSLYIPKVKLSKVCEMNEEKRPVADIINYINAKDNKARDGT